MLYRLKTCHIIVIPRLSCSNISLLFGVISKEIPNFLKSKVSKLFIKWMNQEK